MFPGVDAGLMFSESTHRFYRRVAIGRAAWGEPITRVEC
jgi:hypothetical protein